MDKRDEMLAHFHALSEEMSKRGDEEFEKETEKRVNFFFEKSNNLRTQLKERVKGHSKDEIVDIVALVIARYFIRARKRPII